MFIFPTSGHDELMLWFDGLLSYNFFALLLCREKEFDEGVIILSGHHVGQSHVAQLASDFMTLILCDNSFGMLISSKELCCTGQGKA